MNAREHELIQRHVDGRAMADEAPALQQALKDNAELHALYLDYMNLDVALEAVADAEAVEETTGNEMPVAPPFRFRWRSWAAAAAACLTLALIVNLPTGRKPSPVRPDPAVAIESIQNAIARMPVPTASALPAWMSPTASMLDEPRIPQ